jgi:hypothetical protein
MFLNYRTACERGLLRPRSTWVRGRTFAAMVFEH